MEKFNPSSWSTVIILFPSRKLAYSIKSWCDLMRAVYRSFSIWNALNKCYVGVCVIIIHCSLHYGISRD
jgi:hypothetical protein